MDLQAKRGFLMANGMVRLTAIDCDLHLLNSIKNYSVKERCQNRLRWQTPTPLRIPRQLSAFFWWNQKSKLLGNQHGVKCVQPDLRLEKGFFCFAFFPLAHPHRRNNKIIR